MSGPKVRVIVCPCGWHGRVPNGPIILCARCGGSEWRRETNAETLKRLREEAAARGKCNMCRLRAVKSGTRYCDECIQRATDYRNSIAYRKCQSCGVGVRKRGTLLCGECTAKNSAQHRRWSEANIAAGLCCRCGKHPMVPGFRQCQPCIDEGKDRQLAHNRLVGMAPRDRCSICSAQGLSGTGHNRRTHDRWMERRKAWAP